MSPRIGLCASLCALVLLYAAWFGYDRQWVALAIFALPPLWLLRAGLHGKARTGFWAGVLALAWFSHGIMVAWTRTPERSLATIEIALSLAIVVFASLPGLRARFGRASKPDRSSTPL